MSKKLFSIFKNFTSFSYVLVFFISLQGPIFATTYFVDCSNGLDEGDGKNAKSAFKKIQKATDQCQPGDVVEVLPGIYFEHVNLKQAGRADAPIRISVKTSDRGKVILAGGDPDFYNGKIKWTLEDSELGLYSTPFDHRPYRLLVDGNDLFAYDELSGLKRFRTWIEGKPSPEPSYPGPLQGFAWDSDSSKLYVRLHASGKYGSPNPNGRSFSTSSTFGAKKTTDVGFGPDYGFQFYPKVPGTSAHLIIEGFIFDNPGIAGIKTGGSDLLVRHCVFKGCRSGVQGNTDESNLQGTANRVTVEYCEFHQAPSFDDMVEVIEKYENDAWRGDRGTLNQKIYWWHRKNKGCGNWSYESGIVCKAGSDWLITHNYIHDAFEGLSGGGGKWSRGLRFENNLLERLIDNAFETEDHAQGFIARSNFMVDIFEPVSWQPLDGEPYPGSCLIEGNYFYNHEDYAKLWRQGATPGMFKIGQEKAPRPTKPGDPWVKALSPDQGFVVKGNFVFAPGHRLITTVQPAMRDFDQFYFSNNVFAVAGEKNRFTNNGGGIVFSANRMAYSTENPEPSLEIFSGTSGETIQASNWTSWLSSAQAKKWLGEKWLGPDKGFKLPQVGTEVGPSFVRPKDS
jgi:hypothetical protein